MPHHMVDEAVAAEAIDPATLIAENKTLRDRLLRPDRVVVAKRDRTDAPPQSVAEAPSGTSRSYSSRRAPSSA